MHTRMFSAQLDHLRNMPNPSLDLKFVYKWDEQTLGSLQWPKPRSTQLDALFATPLILCFSSILQVPPPNLREFIISKTHEYWFYKHMHFDIFVWIGSEKQYVKIKICPERLNFWITMYSPTRPRKTIVLQTVELPVSVSNCESTMSVSWYITWNLGWSINFDSGITKSGPFGNKLGLTWYSARHKDDIQGSNSPSYLEMKIKVFGT